MRWFIFLILVLAALWYLRGVEEQPPPAAEDSFIGGPVKSLRKAEGFEKEYLDATKAQQQKMEQQIEQAASGPDS